MRLFMLLAVALSVSGCKSKPQKQETEALAPVAWNSPANAVTVMTYNVENLFDTADDAGKDDATYLPLTKKGTALHQKSCAKVEVPKWREQCFNWDWNEEVLQTKLQRLGNVIRSARNSQGPDILILQEVENKAVLQRLVDDHLKDLGYVSVVLLEGKDLRGIDVAMISKLKLVGRPKLHPIPFKKIDAKRRQDTRGILQAAFQLPDSRTLTVFGVHFPAPFHPSELRVDSLRFLSRLKKQLPADHLVVAAGDFNITKEEDGRLKLIERFADADWLVAHKLGCRECPGTHYYPPKNSWSFLDLILMSKELYDGNLNWKVLSASVRLVNRGDNEQSLNGTPKEFDPVTRSGVSDHWPLAVDLVL